MTGSGGKEPIRLLLFAMMFRGVDRPSFLTFMRIAIWLSVSAVVWVAGGLAETGARLVVTLLEYIALARPSG